MLDRRARSAAASAAAAVAAVAYSERAYFKPLDVKFASQQPSGRSCVSSLTRWTLDVGEEEEEAREWGILGRGRGGVDCLVFWTQFSDFSH